MKQIVVRVTPSRVKFSLCILVILGLAYYAYFYYGQYNEYYQKYNDLLTGSQPESTESAESALEESSTETTPEEASPAEEPASNASDASGETASEASESLSGKLEVKLTAPLYEIKESGDTEKAVISQVRFSVTNGFGAAQNLLVEFHAYDVGETDENKINARKGGDRTTLATLAAGQSITRTILFPSDQRINLYNLDKAKIVQIDLIDKKSFDDSKEVKVLASDKVTLTFT